MKSWHFQVLLGLINFAGMLIDYLFDNVKGMILSAVIIILFFMFAIDTRRHEE